jgi:hypothetical protein
MEVQSHIDIYSDRILFYRNVNQNLASISFDSNVSENERIGLWGNWYLGGNFLIKYLDSTPVWEIANGRYRFKGVTGWLNYETAISGERSYLLFIEGICVGTVTSKLAPEEFRNH